MANIMYFAFWVDRSYEMHNISTASETEIIELRLKADEEFSNVRRLTVIYGELVEFEPVKIVESYRIKET